MAVEDTRQDDAQAQATGQVVVYTAIFGSYDLLIPNKTEHEYHVCFTDTPMQSKGWNVCSTERAYRDPRREARMYKALPHRWFPSADVTVWHDGHIGLKVLPGAVAQFLGQHDIAVFEHPWHDSLQEEANAITLTGRADPFATHRQVNAYLHEGYDGKMFATGVLVRRNNDTMTAFNEAWWAEMSRHTLRDQLSFNYLLWKMGMECGVIPSDMWPGLSPETFWRSEHRESVFHTG